MKVTVKQIEYKEEIDWDKPQLVISKRNRIVHTTGIHDSTTFHGFLIPTDETPDFNKAWAKNQFTLYKGSITLEND
jgi:hypothetical protein